MKSAFALLERAEALRGRGYLEKSARVYQNILALGSQAPPQTRLQGDLGLAAVQRSLGNLDAARRALRRGASLAARLGAREEMEAFELERAMLLRARGRLKEAVRGLMRFTALFRGRGDWGGVGFVLWAVAGARRFMGELSASERDFNASLEAFRRARDPVGRRYALLGLAGLARIRGNPRRSLGIYAEALRQARNSNGGEDLFSVAYSHCGMGNALRQLGRLKEARARYLVSRRLYRKIGDEVDAAYVDWGLGLVETRLGLLGRAEKSFNAALRAFRIRRESRGVALSQSGMASVHYLRGKKGRAKVLFQASLETARLAGLWAPLEIFA